MASLIAPLSHVLAQVCFHNFSSFVLENNSFILFSNYSGFYYLLSLTLVATT